MQLDWRQAKLFSDIAVLDLSCFIQLKKKFQVSFDNIDSLRILQIFLWSIL